jgi:very-short-patch-repair endonuclease
MQAVERAIAAVAGGQDNVITLEQLLDAGLGRGAIAHRVQVRTMQRLHRTVYLIGAAPPTSVARARAAVLAVGGDAVVSHRSAAELYRLLPEAGGDVDVTVVGRNPGVHPGVRIHRPRSIASVDVVPVHRMPVNSIARTICDLAATASHEDVMRAFQEALYRRAVTLRALGAILEREPRRKGAPIVHGLIDDPRLTRSERERLLLKLIDQAQLARPVTNVRLHGHLVDVLWRAERLIVEFDGWGAHGHRRAFETDRKRDQILVAAGYRVLRVTDRQLLGEPIAVVVRIAQALRSSS